MSLERLWCDQGKVPTSARIAGSCVGLVTEGFDTHDLKDAKALVERLTT